MPRMYNPRAMRPSPLIVTHDYNGYDPLALALFNYHADRTTGTERQYWLNRAFDRRPAPNTAIEI
jgi:hypothetical protein